MSHVFVCLQGPAAYNADTYQYYNDSTRLDVNKVRKQLEAWFTIYLEDDEKDELKSRFKVTFNSAFYELYIMASLLSHQPKIEPS